MAIITIYSNITHHVNNTKANTPATIKLKYACIFENLDVCKNKMPKSIMKMNPLNQQIDVQIPWRYNIMPFSCTAGKHPINDIEMQAMIEKLVALFRNFSLISSQFSVLPREIKNGIAIMPESIRPKLKKIPP